MIYIEMYDHEIARKIYVFIMQPNISMIRNRNLMNNTWVLKRIKYNYN